MGSFLCLLLLLLLMEADAYQNNLTGRIKRVDKRALEKSHEKPQAVKWKEAIIGNDDEFNHVPSLVKLLKMISEVYLNRCTPVVLYDSTAETSSQLLLEELFKDYPLPYIHGTIDAHYYVEVRQMLKVLDNQCVSYILLLEDVMRCRDVIGPQNINKVVVVTRSSQWRVYEFLTTEVAKSFVNLLVVAKSEKIVEAKQEQPFILYTHDLYVDGLGSSTPRVLTSWIRGNLTRPWIQLFPAKMTEGFAGHRFIISVAHQPPFVIKRSRDENDDIKWDGIEIRLMKLLAETYNFTTDFREARNPDTYGSGNAIMLDLIAKRADIGMGGLYIVPERIGKVDISYRHSQDCASFISLTSTALPRCVYVTVALTGWVRTRGYIFWVVSNLNDGRYGGEKKNDKAKTHNLKYSLANDKKYCSADVFLIGQLRTLTAKNTYRKWRQVFSGRISITLLRWRAIMGPFQWTVWLALTLIYLLAIFPLAFSDRHTLKYLLKSPQEVENMFWYVFGTFTNCFSFTGKNSWSNSEKLTTRLLIGFYWIFTIILTACYTGSIIAFVTLPVFPETTDTVDQLVKGRYQVGTLDKGGWQYWFTNSSDPVAKRLLKNIEYVSTIDAGIKNITSAFFWSYAFLGSNAQLDYVVRTNFSTSNKRSLLHISSECFVPYGIGVAFQTDSIFKSLLNQGILRAVQSGFLIKIKNDVEWVTMRSTTGKLLQANRAGPAKTLIVEDRALVLDDTQGMFLLLSFGFLMGGIALLSEWLGGCFNLCRKKRRGSAISNSSSLSSNPRAYDIPTPREKLDSIQYSRSSFIFGASEDKTIDEQNEEEEDCEKAMENNVSTKTEGVESQFDIEVEINEIFNFDKIFGEENRHGEDMNEELKDDK